LTIVIIIFFSSIFLTSLLLMPDGKYKAATVKTPTTFNKPPPAKKSLTDLP
jgi:hypothetical protein